MSQHHYQSVDGKVPIMRTQLNCEVRTRTTESSVGSDLLHITLSCPPLQLERDNTEQVHEHAHARTTARRA